MTDREEITQALVRRADIALGLSKATMILGMDRNKFIELMRSAAEVIRQGNASTVPFQAECKCGRKITVAFVNGQRKVKWSE